MLVKYLRIDLVNLKYMCQTSDTKLKAIKSVVNELKSYNSKHTAIKANTSLNVC